MILVILAQQVTLEILVKSDHRVILALRVLLVSLVKLPILARQATRVQQV